MKRAVFIAVSFVALLLAWRPRASAQQIDPRDRLEYGGVVLEPGDVISFRGGVATVRGMLLTHGHASLYLGFDLQTQQQIFLDFSTTKDGVPEMVLGSPRAFGGRIMSEREFLTYHLRAHQSFDVYRLNDRSTLDKRKMFRKAKLIAKDTRYGLSFTVCSSAVSDVLSAATTGLRIGVVTPDGFDGPPFRKHPQQGSDPIDIEQVLRQLGRITAPPAQQAAERNSGGFLSRVVDENRHLADTQRVSEALDAEIRVPDTSAEDSARRQARAAAWQYLKATLHLACADPDNLRSLDEQRRTWGVLISRGSVEEFFGHDRQAMTDCAQQLMTSVVNSLGPVDLKWVEKQGRKHYRAEQRRLRREQEAAARAERAAASARAEYEEAEGRLASGNGGSSGSQSRGAEGSAYRQAVGIAGGNVRIFDGR
jgi:hypothetical protein